MPVTGSVGTGTVLACVVALCICQHGHRGHVVHIGDTDHIGRSCRTPTLQLTRRASWNTRHVVRLCPG